MTNRITRILAVVLGAASLASVAYALGTQSNGTAIGAQAGQRGEGRGHHGPDLSALATKLGVSESRLRTAFEELRTERGGDRKDHDARRREMTNALAKELGVSAERVQNALDRTFERRMGDRPGGPGGRGPGGGPNPNALAADLARELNIEQGKVRTALDKVRAAHEAEHEQRRRQMATELAKKLDLPAAKVQQALESMPRGPHGRP